MEVLGAGGGVFGHFGVHQFAGRIGKQRGAAVVAVFGDILLTQLLHLRHPGGVQVLDDFLDRRARLEQFGHAAG